MGNERCKWEKTFGEIFCGKGKDNGWGGERVKIIVRHRKFCVIRINKKKLKKSINAFFFLYILGSFIF